MKKMNSNWALVLSLFTVFVASTTYADSCVSEFNDNTSISAAGKVGIEIENENDLKQAKWAVGFLDRCANETDGSWTEVVKKNMPTIVENIKKFESKQSSVASAKLKCPNFDSCDKKLHPEGNDRFGNTMVGWYSRSPEQLKSIPETDIANVPNAYEVDVPSAKAFAEECSCYVKSNGLAPQADFAVALMKKWTDKVQASEAAAKEAAVKQAAADKIQDQKNAVEAAKNKAAELRTAKLLSTPQCKAAQAKKEFCKYRQLAKIFSIKAEQEKEVGNQSGFVNAKKLRDDTASKINFEKWAAKESQKYQQAAGKAPSVGDCPLPTEDQFDVRIPASIKSDVSKFCGTGEDEN